MQRHNDVLRSARLKRGWNSQEAAARAVSRTGRAELDDPSFEVSARTWRRWESAAPGWPREDAAVALRAAFGVGPERLGFLPPDGLDLAAPMEDDVHRRSLAAVTAPALVAGPTARANESIALSRS